ncbi:MAG: HTH-type transcriptional repressor KstR2 [bacterium ADurb.BinA028]|nr:MAG: HTH-type transcriptional repressor KstR2 [bacterium ADurb.BinA028]
MLSTVSTTPAAVTPASETVQRLFSAAAEAFAAKGFHATTTRDIASRAGLSPAGVYVHFASKEDLLFHLSRDGHEEALALVTEAVAGARDVLAAGKQSGDFLLDDIPDTALALLSIIVDVARWYTPALHRTSAQIGATNAALGLRLVGYRGGQISQSGTRAIH